jgi:hypothetical protein
MPARRTSWRRRCPPAAERRRPPGERGEGEAPANACELSPYPSRGGSRRGSRPSPVPQRGRRRSPGEFRVGADAGPRAGRPPRAPRPQDATGSSGFLRRRPAGGRLAREILRRVAPFMKPATGHSAVRRRHDQSPIGLACPLRSPQAGTRCLVGQNGRYVGTPSVRTRQITVVSVPLKGLLSNQECLAPSARPGFAPAPGVARSPKNVSSSRLPMTGGPERAKYACLPNDRIPSSNRPTCAGGGPPSESRIPESASLPTRTSAAATCGGPIVRLRRPDVPRTDRTSMSRCRDPSRRGAAAAT